MVTVVHHASVHTIANAFKIIDSLYFDCLTGNHQKCQNFSLSKFCTSYTVKDYSMGALIRACRCEPLTNSLCTDSLIIGLL